MAGDLPRPGASPRPPKRAGFAGAHVLLVEDEPVNATIAQGYLAELGCTSVWVANGLEAVALSSSEQFDLIMMDINMPNMDGFAATRLIRQRESKERRIPVVALTAHVAAAYSDKCHAAGMDDVISKPYTLEDCRRLLGRWVKAPVATDGAKDSAGMQAEPETEPLVAMDAHAVAGLLTLQNGRLYSTLVALFRSSAAESMAGLEAALTRRDCNAAGAICHKLTAAAANVGALAFAREVQRLGALCATDDVAGANAIVARLSVALPKLCEGLLTSRLRARA